MDFWLEIATRGALLYALLCDHLWHLENASIQKNKKHRFKHRESTQNQPETSCLMIFYSKIRFWNICPRFLRHFFHQNHWVLSRKSWKYWKIMIYIDNCEVVGALLPNHFGQSDTRWLSTLRDTLISGIVWQCFLSQISAGSRRSHANFAFFGFRSMEQATLGSGAWELLDDAGRLQRLGTTRRTSDSAYSVHNILKNTAGSGFQPIPGILAVPCDAQEPRHGKNLSRHSYWNSNPTFYVFGSHVYQRETN